MAEKRTGDLADNTALVTGATSGIGRAIALKLARDGAEVIVHGHPQAAEMTRSACRGTPFSCRHDRVSQNAGSATFAIVPVRHFAMVDAEGVTRHLGTALASDTRCRSMVY